VTRFTLDRNLTSDSLTCSLLASETSRAINTRGKVGERRSRVVFGAGRARQLLLELGSLRDQVSLLASVAGVRAILAISRAELSSGADLAIIEARVATHDVLLGSSGTLERISSA